MDLPVVPGVSCHFLVTEIVAMCGTYPRMHVARPAEMFIIDIGASKISIGVVLTQIQNGQE
jgi:hypothetical protein